VPAQVGTTPHGWGMDGPRMRRNAVARAVGRAGSCDSSTGAAAKNTRPPAALSGGWRWHRAAWLIS